MMTSGARRILSESWLVLLLAAVFGAALAAVHAGLAARIEANKRAETLRQVPGLLGLADSAAAEVEIGGNLIRITSADGVARELEIAERDIAGRRVLAVSNPATGDPFGWVVQGAGQGYADTIELLIGVSPDASLVTGLYVLSQKETPALGDGITKIPFRQRFIGRPTNRPLTVTRDPESGQGILALTAATISSQSVCEIVNRTLADVRPVLAAREAADS